jgi:hypothetical protein
MTKARTKIQNMPIKIFKTLKISHSRINPAIKTATGFFSKSFIVNYFAFKKCDEKIMKLNTSSKQRPKMARNLLQFSISSSFVRIFSIESQRLHTTDESVAGCIVTFAAQS